MHLNYEMNIGVIGRYAGSVSHSSRTWFNLSWKSIASHSSNIIPFFVAEGIPQVHYFGQEGLHNVLVIDLLGPNLEDLVRHNLVPFNSAFNSLFHQFDMCGRKFSIKTVAMAAKQMVRYLLPLLRA